MKILIACEESQVVCKEFRKLGHEAYSCDIEPCSGGHPEWHLMMDVKQILKRHWDMIIAFPPCTYLCSSGMHWTTRGLRDPQLTTDAIKFAQDIWNADCEKIVLENSVGVLSRKIRKPDQIIQPWQFGHDASKQTCLWLKGVDKLEPTDIVPPKGFYNVTFASDLDLCSCCEEPWCHKCVGPTQDGYDYVDHRGSLFAFPEGNRPKKMIWGNQTSSGQNKLGPSKDRARLRSETYPGVAKAMAAKWGSVSKPLKLRKKRNV